MPLGRFFSKGPEKAGDIDIEDYLNELSIREGKIIESADITYVKPVELDSEGKGIGTVISELEKNNIVVLNVKSILHNKTLLKEVIRELRDACVDMDGDIGRVSEDKILVVPSGMRIAHKEATESAK